MRVLDFVIEKASEIFAPQGILQQGAIAVGGGDLVYVGSAEGLSEACAALGWREGRKTRHIDATGCLITPGLITPYFHLFFPENAASDRADAERLRQERIEAIQKASLRELMALGRKRLDRMLSCGVTVVESHSGDGLQFETQLKILEAGRQLDASHAVDVVNGFSLETLPPEFSDRRQAFVDSVCNDWLPRLAAEQFIDICSISVKDGALSLKEAQKIATFAQSLGIAVKLCGDRKNALKIAEFASKIGAIAVEGLAQVSDAGMEALASSRITAVLWPLDAFFKAEAQALARRLSDASLPVALSPHSDCCICENPQFCMTLGVARLGLSPKEALESVTCNAAKALGLEETRGQLLAGCPADLVIFDTPSLQRLPYRFGLSQAVSVIKDGEVVFKKDA